MNPIKLIACLACTLVTSTLISSCEKDSDNSGFIVKNGIPFTGAQIRPVASPSPGSGEMDVWYDKETKVLNYALRWTGLTDSVIAIRINGPAPIGFNAVNPAFSPAPAAFTSFATTPYREVQTFLGSAPRALLPPSGTFAGSMLVDGVRVTEDNLMNGQYFVTLHTKTLLPVAIPGSFLFRWLGEVRAQITLQ